VNQNFDNNGWLVLTRAIGQGITIYDKETNVITVPSSQFIIWDSPYGKLTLVGMTPEADDFTETITFTFNPGGGAMKSSNWECVFIEGDYQGYTWGNGNYLVMQHD
jgi:hypothetical protein